MSSRETDKQTMEAPLTLWSAAKANDVAGLARLLDAGAPIDERDHRGYSALMLAAYTGNVEAFDLLLSRRADPDSRDLLGNTVLMGAAFKGHLGMFHKLIAAGASAGLRNDAGQDARSFATMFGRAEIVKALDELAAPAQPRAVES